MSEAEPLESYKRRNTIRSLAVKKNRSMDNNGECASISEESGRECCFTGHFNRPLSAKRKPKQASPNECHVF